MSGLLGGADCGPSNALKNFSKHVDSDKSLQRDRVRNGRQGPGAFREQREMRGEDKAMMQEFMNQSRQQEPHFAHQQQARHQQQQHNNWNADFANFNVPAQDKIRMEQAFRNAPQQNQLDPAWRSEFFSQQHIPPEMQAAATSSFMGAPMNGQYNGLGMGMAFGGMNSMNYGSLGMYNNGQQQGAAMQQAKGKERLIELSSENWEEQFKALDVQEGTELEQLPSIDKEEEEDFRDFESIWKDMQEENPALAEEWANEFQSPLDDQGRPNLGEYLFEPENPYLTHENPYQEGQSLLANGQSLSEAALCFEAVCQREGEDLQKGWSALGLCQAQNEKEEAAIKALENAVRLDPKDLQALMGLAVSYTNDGYDTAAYLSLERWLEAKYPNLVSGIEVNNTNRKEVHEKVTAQFIKAAQLSPNGAEMDADVQVGLGVLFYGDEEYEKAVDCFTAALRIRPEDALLWNRLGATLANSGKSEDAIEAYTRALEIAPTFVRCRYNLGVSCINIGCYEEAAQHLLSGLAMHQLQGDAGGGVNLSTNLWETLRRVFLVGMNRPDLSKLAVSGADVQQFRGEFEF
ncbi:Tetratricopeptide repeat protein [Taphrina deformans PYCC 5710]|uniref:Tetratricopeptide repeat protein n=1 Tax=Taphrina deformans (strain PYCC 5710 / ATCC 11124 / CBS 356.35 / IMI 108563 / JCM 9778 / NBRC 8474) TaxID=1097556 RepID=R4XB19_TAPDE|nr:Tetratricopeptide repeat protein [Taphrina deformans PYCC 5710]|eukprot:CCG81523.1 Tetratricopeptide repeat protein [Taphrina deformans PYCC 5710]